MDFSNFETVFIISFKIEFLLLKSKYLFKRLSKFLTFNVFIFKPDVKGFRDKFMKTLKVKNSDNFWNRYFDFKEKILF